MRTSQTRHACIRTLLGTVSLLCAAGAASPSNVARAQGGPPLDERRSLAITDVPILDRFPFARVMDQLASLSGSAGMTGISLFRSWWDTQNPASQGSFPGAHCDDVQVAGVPSINGYPYDCRAAPHEGRQVQCSSFSDPDCAYIPIGLFNRFDLAPPNGAHCGEYRIVYAKQSGVSSPLERNLIIFEAVLPNPTPNAGLPGCLPIAQFWASLSHIPQIAQRANQLETFYFNGSGNVPAVVRPEHYGDNATARGQIRTNQFVGFTAVTPRVWTLREFKLTRTCPSCDLEVRPVPDAVNPFGPLFSPTSAHANKAAFDAAFPGQVAALAASSISGISMSLSPLFDTAQSHSSGSNEMRYDLQFSPAPSTLRASIQQTLTSIGSGLTPDDIVARAQAMTCAGCHRLSDGATLGGGITWPTSLGFVHVTERQTEVVGGVTRYLISPALTNEFLPHRKHVLSSFTSGAPLPPVPAGRPIGGRSPH